MSNREKLEEALKKNPQPVLRVFWSRSCYIDIAVYDFHDENILSLKPRRVMEEKSSHYISWNSITRLDILYSEEIVEIMIGLIKNGRKEAKNFEALIDNLVLKKKFKGGKDD